MYHYVIKILADSNISAMIKILRVDPMILAIFPYVLPFFVPTQGFAHIEGILDRFSAGRVVAVVINHSSEDAVSIVKVSY